jgi:hypothetical protein
MTDSLSRAPAPVRAHADAHVREAIAQAEARRKATVDQAKAVFEKIRAKALERFQRERDAILAGKPADPPKPQEKKPEAKPAAKPVPPKPEPEREWEGPIGGWDG